jgi:hypothetical protein
LVAGDRSGNLNIYPDISDKLSGNFTAASNDFVFNDLQNKNTVYRFGAETFPAVYGDDIAIGLAGGGLQFLKSKMIINGIENLPNYLAEIEIFPNPTSDYIILKTKTRGEVKILNIMGGQVGDYQIKNIGEAHSISLKNLPKGLYLVEFVNQQGARVIKRIVLN